MKISDKLYDKLDRYIKIVLHSRPNAAEQYKAAGLLDERFRWDMFSAANEIASWDNLGRVLYASGLNDKHIDSALRRIVEGKIAPFDQSYKFDLKKPSTRKPPAMTRTEREAL